MHEKDRKAPAPKPKSTMTTGAATEVNLDVAKLREHLHRNVPLLDDEDRGEDDDEVTAVTDLGALRARGPALSIDDSAPTPLPEGVRASLDILDGPQVGRSFPLTTLATVAGRTSKGVSFEDVSLSRTHAVFVYVDGEFRVRDAGSANGVYLNGAKVVDYRLCDGDEVMLGRTTLLFNLNVARASQR